jgi:signal transduction histidine kinase
MAGLERANAVSVERERIARDLHDEVGATLTAVATRLELAGRGAEPGPAAEVRRAQELLQGAARTMSDIIWSTDPRQDTLEATVAYLSQYAADFLEAGGLQYDLVLPSEVPRQPLPAALRHDLLLVVKEALNNVLRHARAVRVRMSWAFAPGELALCLEDDGGGLGAGPGHRNGNGIANMRRRVETHRGTFEIEARDGQGTRVCVHLPLSRGGSVAVAVRVPHGGPTDP